MKRLIIAVVSLSLSLAAAAGVATAQDGTAPEKSINGIITNADGSNVSSRAGLNPTANGEGGTIVYGDITTGPGIHVIGPPTVEYAPLPPEAAPAPAPEPEPVVADTTTTETVAADTTTTAVATETDLDADNYADSLEWDLGLDPNVADTDGDGVADGDELNIYGTEPTVFDTDGDGVADGEELFGALTDPLVWDDFSAPATDGTEAVAQESVAPSQTYQSESTTSTEPLAQETTENVTATNGDAAALGTGNASAAPGTVTRDGSSGISLLGPDGTYTVTETSPPNVNVSGNAEVTGDTEVIGPPAEPAASNDTGSAYSCNSYGSWYDAQVDYEAAGLTAADPALVAALDPDYDGIACEEGM